LLLSSSLVFQSADVGAESTLNTSPSPSPHVARHSKMKRLLIIVFFCFALFDSSYGQKPERKKPKETLITKTADSKQNPLQDTAFLDNFSKIYADSVLAIVDSLLQDS